MERTYERVTSQNFAWCRIIRRLCAQCGDIKQWGSPSSRYRTRWLLHREGTGEGHPHPGAALEEPRHPGARREGQPAVRHEHSYTSSELVIFTHEQALHFIEPRSAASPGAPSRKTPTRTPTASGRPSTRRATRSHRCAAVSVRAFDFRPKAINIANIVLLAARDPERFLDDKDYLRQQGHAVEVR